VGGKAAVCVRGAAAMIDSPTMLKKVAPAEGTDAVHGIGHGPRLTSERET
jgi:hypothetical protein